ncbi:MAG TPA: DUF2207 domain-containing protein [Pseudomonadales bacterium]
MSPGTAWRAAQGRLAWCLTGGLLLLAQVALGEERILTYHADIRIGADAGLTITETIRVRAEGDQIRRGIYRDFPTRYEDRFGNAYVVAFDVRSVTRDGAPESFHSEARSNGVRVYMGSADRMLAPGEHTYALTYTTDRSIGYFQNQDELYWNITGTDWAFPIDEASARVTLPTRVPPEALTVEGYTGPFGSRGRDFLGRTETGAATIVTTRVLGPREGLTLVVTWPKGIVFEPDASDRVRYLLEDNLGLLLALTVLAAVGTFLFAGWRRYGRDPAPGVVFAQYEPPAGYSPGAVRYIRGMGYDANTLTAAVVSLAVKGYLRIRQDDDEYTLEQSESSEPLGPGEEALKDALFAKGPVVALDNENHELVGAARRAHKKALRRHYYSVYFVNNAEWLVPTFAGSLMAFFALLLAELLTPAAIAVFVLNGALQVLFLWLMKSPTRRGRALMDKLDGFELYLKVAEKDDLDIRHPPELTPALFERYLPFAIALGVANEWAEQFATVLFRMDAAERAGYAPGWYRGDFQPHRLNRFVKDVGSSFSSAIASAATPPGSSSGSGGGGSSGGGGGGGGGGGW